MFSGRRFDQIAQLVQQVVQIFGGQVLVLRQDALDHLAAVAIEVAGFAVQQRLVGNIYGDAEGRQQPCRQPRPFVERLQAEPPGVVAGYGAPFCAVPDISRGA